MVLLTMTPTMVTAIEKYLQIVTSRDKSNGDENDDVLADEPSLEHPAVGNPISHGQVMDIFTRIRQHRFASEMDMQDGQKSYNKDQEFQLEDLLRGSRVYVPPPQSRSEPVSYPRPCIFSVCRISAEQISKMDDYKTLMNNLRRQEEERAYEQMVSRPSTAKVYQPHDRQTAKPTPFPPTTDEDDEMTYADVNRQMALILNIIISIVACSFAIWTASRHWSTPLRLGLSFGGSVLVAIAEVVVYAGYLGKLKGAKERGKDQFETKEIINTWVIGGGKSDGSARDDLPKGDTDDGATEMINSKTVTPVTGTAISGSQTPLIIENDMREDQRSSGVSRAGPLPTPRRRGM